ncbi:MAG: tetratricopeptide repeat protein [Candidatus Gastranaerophilales bacterium]|nr:tetratricopeptide repeat protein [Candidatus Gastranaerophilales bacterium]
MDLKYKELTDKAYYYHSINNFEKAEEIYKQLLSVNPDDYNVLNLYGLLCLSLRKPQDSVNLLNRAYVLKKNSYIASNLAKAYYMNSEYIKAVKIYKQALELGENDDIYYSLGLAYKKISDYDKSIENYKKSIELNPKNYNSCYNLSLIYKELNDISQALFYAKKCIEIKQEDDVYASISGYYEDLNDISSAIEALKTAILLNSKNCIYFYNLGVLFSKEGKTDEALAAYSKCIELNENYVEAYVNTAFLYKGKDNEKALEYLKKAYEINPDEKNVLLSLAQTYRDLYNNNESIKILNKLIEKDDKSDEAYSLLGVNNMDLGNYASALNYYDKAVNLNPSNLNFLHGKAIALKYLGRIDEAKEILEYIVENDKDAVQSATTLGMIYLTDKDFKKGMKLYSLRSKESKFNEVFKNRVWEPGCSLNDKNVLVYSDCGLGDTIMFSRFLPILKKKAKSLTLQTDKELVSVLKNSFKDVNIIRKSITPDDYDTVISIMDLQYALNIDFEKISSKPYLSAEKDKVKKLSEICDLNNKKYKIGLFWQGNKRIFKNRSIDFSYIKKILLSKNNNFYSFQINNDEKDEHIYPLKDFIKDYSDTAALLMNMDLLITIDSSIAHMAGAIGVKTFLLLPYTAEWRWFNDCSSTIWYESVKIFRQSQIGNWDSVIDDVLSELNKL